MSVPGPRRLLALALPAALLVGCGGHSAARAPTLPEAQKRLAGAPPSLAGLHAQANAVLPGGRPAFEARLAALRGHAVVLNKWASWCAPCRVEFPVLRRVSVKLGRSVAFLGLDSRDRTSAARRYLRAEPLSYPSYADPRERIAATHRMPEGFPLTNFYDARGRLAYQHAGPYTSDRALERDIQRYALR